MEVLHDRDGVRLGRLVTGPLENNVYLLTCSATGSTVVVDAAGEAPLILEACGDRAVRSILTTHGHADHVGAAPAVAEALGIPIRIHPLDAGAAGLPAADPLADGERIRIGRLDLEVLHVPGHTPGSVCFLAGSLLLSGDTLFPGGPGATAGPDEFRRIMHGLERRIFALPDATRVLPGHGAGTTIGAERPSLPEWWARGY